MEKIVVGGAYSTYGDVYRCIKDFGGRTEGKKTTWKSQA